MIRILLVDDQSLIRQGLKALLDLESDLQIVGEAENGEVALRQIDPLQPDVVLMDIRMPIMDGVATTRILHQQFPQIKVLVLTTFDDEDYVAQALQYGAVGYLLKDTPAEEIATAIRAVHRGYAQLSPGILQKLVGKLAIAPAIPTPELPPGFAELTPREREVLQFLAQGLSNREIAQQLYLSEGTIKNHVTNILGRLGLRDRTQAALLARSLQSHLETPPE